MRGTVFSVLFFLFTYSSEAQDSSLLTLLKEQDKPSTSNVSATFKATHIVNLQTVESPAKGDLNFIIMHRFGKINDGSYNFFGLDNATLRLGLDYGITDRLAAGIGRSSLEKTFDGYLKYKLLRQTEDGKMPVSVSLLETVSNYTQKFTDKTYLNAKYRTTYVSQILIARKINRSVSLQLAPAMLHFNLVPTTKDNNDVFAATVGGRVKFTKRMSITGEYTYLPSGQINSRDVKNSLSLGWDIETGGHVFQLVFSNSQGMTESQYITRTTGSWGKGDIYFGFNISRNFTLKKK
jgi:hypothetical protein